MTVVSQRNAQEITFVFLLKGGLRNRQAPTMLFGSYARRAAGSASDIDVLQLSDSSSAYTLGSISVTIYREKDLSAMAARGSLFVLHLLTEGIILQDENGTLATVLEKWHAPPSYEPLFMALREVSGALDVEESVFRDNPNGFTGLAVFLTRTELYGRCAAAGNPRFDFEAAARDCDVSEVTTVIAQCRTSAPSWTSFCELREMLRARLYIPCSNQHGSLEALVVHLDARTPTGAALVLRVLQGASSIAYHDLPKDDVPW
jgi:hypothetical protein